MNQDNLLYSALKDVRSIIDGPWDDDVIISEELLIKIDEALTHYDTVQGEDARVAELIFQDDYKKWRQSEGWVWHRDQKHWYKLEYPSQWPPLRSNNKYDSELLELFKSQYSPKPSTIQQGEGEEKVSPIEIMCILFEGVTGNSYTWDDCIEAINLYKSYNLKTPTMKDQERLKDFLRHWREAMDKIPAASPQPTVTQQGKEGGDEYLLRNCIYLALIGVTMEDGYSLPSAVRQQIEDKIIRRYQFKSPKPIKETEGEDHGICKRCEKRDAVKDYNGQQYWVCEPCYEMLSDEFDEEYK